VIRIRIGGEEIVLEDQEWRVWVEDGRIPPDAAVYTEAGWVPARMLPAYRAARDPREPVETPPPDVLPVLFPKRGLSATETVVLVNLVVGAVLMLAWGGDYSQRLYSLAAGWWHAVSDRHAYWWWLPPSVLHADLEHLGSNMISLLAGAGAVEFLSGSRWVFVVYLATALGCSLVSYLGHDGPPLSVGASGAVFGLAGATMTFVMRRYGDFSPRQKWKARRVYSALFVLFLLPSIFGADYWGHLGGFAAGLLIGPFLPMHPRLFPPRARS
jgi:membrane associated rhomboid family serine protease